ncbi:MAG: hypothetical protein KDN05_01905, partial [Verrucomicrobiae bacterium]|nr:hypothetical protein [Verrucomicrobiae bacterium]
MSPDLPTPDGIRRAGASRQGRRDPGRTGIDGSGGTFSLSFRNSTFIGGPTWTWTPSRPSERRWAESSSTTTDITR